MQYKNPINLARGNHCNVDVAVKIADYQYALQEEMDFKSDV